MRNGRLARCSFSSDDASASTARRRPFPQAADTQHLLLAEVPFSELLGRRVVLVYDASSQVAAGQQAANNRREGGGLARVAQLRPAAVSAALLCAMPQRRAQLPARPCAPHWCRGRATPSPLGSPPGWRTGWLWRWAPHHRGNNIDTATRSRLPLALRRALLPASTSVRRRWLRRPPFAVQVRGDALCFYARPHADLCQADWQALDNAIYGELCEARLAFCVRDGAGRAFGAWQASLPMHAAACGASAEDARGKAAAAGHLRPPPPPPRSSSSRAAGPRLQTCARWLRTFGQASAACFRRTLRLQDCGGGLRLGAGLEALELVLPMPGTSGLTASPHAGPALPASTRAPRPCRPL